MRACLVAGSHYVDLGGLYWMTGRQLELHRDFEQAGLLALLGMGSSPGKTNVMAVAAARALGTETVDELHIAAAGRDPDADPSRGLALPYALETLVDELTMAPVVVRDGEPLEIEPMTHGGDAWLGGPIGEAPTIYTLHSELRTFPDSFGCREASFRLSLEPSILPRLRELAALPPKERSAHVVPPGPRTVSVHVVEARKAGASARVGAITRPSERWGLGGGIVSTAAPAAAAVRLMARGTIRAAGALPPERCVDPRDLFPELEERGCEVTTEMLEAVEA
jgi:lysine 6-dehydrogenase